MDVTQKLPEVLKDLANAATTQVHVSNRYWLVLLVASTFVAFPGDVKSGMIQLPFNLGKVYQQDFSVVGLLMVSVLVIAFCSAHAQVLRVQSFVHRMLENNALGEMPGGHDGRDFFDALRVPSITRVAPLPQLVRGRNQFFIDKVKVPNGTLIATGMYYAFLKILSIFVYFGFPVLALTVAVSRYRNPAEGGPHLEWLVWPFVVGAAITLIQLLIYEVHHIWKALKAISLREE